MKCVHVLRKPCSESTVAANVLRWGTGALNIDATRISYETGGTSASNPITRKEQGYLTRRGAGVAPTSFGLNQAGEMNINPLGRWPANLILQHLDGCVQDGTRRVKTSGFDQSRPPRSPGIVYGKHKDTPQVRHSDPDGTETVAAWVCAPMCPVKGSFPLEGRSTKPSASGVSTRNKGASLTGMGGIDSNPCYFDAGSASRFFKQVKP